MAKERRPRPTITETVGELDGKKVLVVRADGEIIAVQPRKIVAQRIANLVAQIADLDEGLAKSDDEHLAATNAQLDRLTEKIERQRKALTAEGVGLATRGRLQIKRDRVAAQKATLDDVLVQLSEEEPQVPTAAG